MFGVLCSSSMPNKRKRDLSVPNINLHRNGHPSMDLEIVDNKKSRVDRLEASPSRVIHIRNMPADATENEIALFAIPFGLLKNMVLSKRNNQALIEMHVLEESVQLVAHYLKYPVTLHGKHLIFQFSTHSHLELISENDAIVNAIKNANRVVQQDLPGAQTGVPNTVLHVVIDNIMGQQINHVILYKIFHRFGIILRVLIFLRNNQYRCLLEFQDHIQAFVAMLLLNGQNIYTGCCSLQVEFWKARGPLEVRRENDKCRDYTVSPLTEAELNSLQALPSGVSASTNNSTINTIPQPTIGQNISLGNPTTAFTAIPQASASGINDLAIQLTLLAQQSGLALTPAAAAATASFMALTAQSGNPAINQAPATILNAAALQSPRTALTTVQNPTQLLPNIINQSIPNMGQTATSTVLIVSNLNEEKVYPDALFTLFGVYGDVTRVKIMFNKKSTALVQFSDPQQALTALYYLNGQPLYGRPLKISVSRFNIVQLPKEDTDVGLTKDYTNSPLHRFRKPNSKNFSNIYAPNHVLHLSNIPSDITEEEVRMIFETKGYHVTDFKFLLKDKKMALIQLENVDMAIQAMIDLHNCQLTENSHLRISFSKTAI
ncbi:Polypyrimidine tract-binding protein isoform 1 [Schistosoma japonicum]|uniref:Polypyrimidine tract-binding protein 1 n=4 Tax=Schistosoma japonicum TaxID=6182 RepID=C1LLD8_SCHJA|nr:Polypyrimidine tract-binding protein 1 [Schistosoma japonicum]TNN21382.1 Polypyrimidine tract-binding protein isoform 1 [Schistosoma japonicum]CAX75515.1 Polypyrimidine tract-binding protein 1 [Schistosoma japonicum]CAX75516.1 Polypyrimidine tract-binding protein 1 [Schistosoma japonicum]